jgi:hypothetical protein
MPTLDISCSGKYLNHAPMHPSRELTRSTIHIIFRPASTPICRKYPPPARAGLGKPRAPRLPRNEDCC